MMACGQTVPAWRHRLSISPRRNSGAARSCSSKASPGGTGMFMSALDPLLRHEVEAQLAAMAMHELVQGRVARRAVRRIAELQNVLGRVLRAQLEGVRRPLLHGADASARWELVLGGLLQEVNRGLDAVAAGYVHPSTVFQAVHRLMALAV